MKRVIRGAILLMAVIMYIGLIYGSEDITIAVLRIISVALLLVGMESVRRKGEKLYHKNSDINAIDHMGENEFREYIAQIYKKLGYYVQPNTDIKKKHYDFLIRKDKKTSIIKCVQSKEMIHLEQARSIVEQLENIRVKNRVIITNQRFEEDVMSYLKAEEVLYTERRDLIKMIEETIQKETLLGKRTKVQET